MDALTPTKPYMLRAMHEWCIDNNLTPHLLVVVNGQTRVPMAYVKDGEIVLNLSYGATKDLHLDNEAIVFSARFGGVSQNLYVPVDTVKAIFARENGEGMFFDVGASDASKDVSVDSVPERQSAKADDKKTSIKKPTLTIVK
ncbi:MAG: ClpXP protease specificity-enhancing factor [Pseudomonadota bacterium]